MKTPLSHGYPCVNLRLDGETVLVRVHQLLARAFIGPVPDGMEVRHNDGNPGNCRLDNLCYGTRAQNIEDAKRQGTFPILEQRPGAILTRDRVAVIAADTRAAHVIAAEHGVKAETVQQIRGGITWASVTDGKRLKSYRPRGVAVHGAKLTEADVAMIRSSAASARFLGRRLGVNHKTIMLVRNRRTWKHVAGA